MDVSYYPAVVKNALHEAQGMLDAEKLYSQQTTEQFFSTISMPAVRKHSAAATL